jgi:hypothetical protein
MVRRHKDKSELDNWPGASGEFTNPIKHMRISETEICVQSKHYAFFGLTLLSFVSVESKDCGFLDGRMAGAMVLSGMLSSRAGSPRAASLLIRVLP